MERKSSFFTKFARSCSKHAGKSGTFLFAIAIILVWAVTGPLFGFSDTWQLVINTSTTIITFLMVFIIQNTQNRDTGALQLKLDELIRISSGKNAMLDLEELSEEDLDKVQKEYLELAEQARDEQGDDGAPKRPRKSQKSTSTTKRKAS